MHNVGSRTPSPWEEKGAQARANQGRTQTTSAQAAPRQPGRQEGVGTGEPTPQSKVQAGSHRRAATSPALSPASQFLVTPGGSHAPTHFKHPPLFPSPKRTPEQRREQSGAGPGTPGVAYVPSASRTSCPAAGTIFRAQGAAATALPAVG